MSESTYTDVFGDEVVLADSVREVILHKHPEAADFIAYVKLVLADPDEVRRSIRDARVVLFYRFF